METPNSIEDSAPTGTLFIVSTPIGNFDDITLRAIEVLKKADLVVCEELKVGARLLHQHRVSKPIEELHEHNEQEQTEILLQKLQTGSALALISDCGTPLVADPGQGLVRRALELGINVTAIPGVSSILTALVTSGLDSSQFLYAGFLSRESDERLQQLRSLAKEPRTVVLLETPYRLKPFLEAAATVLADRRAYLGCNLTMPSETHHYGTIDELWRKFSKLKFKGEFVLCFAGFSAGERKPHSRKSHTAKKFGGSKWSKKASGGQGKTSRFLKDRSKSQLPDSASTPPRPLVARKRSSS